MQFVFCMATVRAAPVRQGRMEVDAALQCAATFHCQVKHWHDCDELKPTLKEMWTFCGQEQNKHKKESNRRKGVPRARTAVT